MENGDQVTKRGCLCPQDSRGEGVSNPNYPLIYAALYRYMLLQLRIGKFINAICARKKCPNIARKKMPKFQKLDVNRQLYLSFLQ